MSEMKESPEDFSYNNGLEIVEPAANELQLDLDRPEDVAYFKAQLDILKQMYKVRRVNYTKSRSGNTHAYVVLDESLGLHERIALQACLGSDRKREILSIKNHLNGKKRPVFLYEVAS